MSAVRELIDGHPFLTGLDRVHRTELSVWARASSFAGGTRIFEEGARADRFWLIREGLVTLDTQVPGRGAVVIESLGSGAALGWSWLFPPYAWRFGATAIEPTMTIEFDAPGVRRSCEEDPVLGFELSRRFTRVVVDRLQATRLRLLDLYGAP